MKEQIIYSVRVASIEYGGLKIWHVKIGITSNIKQTLSGYSRSNMEASLLDLWHANSDLDSLTCEKGVHSIAEKYAYKRENEKFIFLQNSYEDFKRNVAFLLKVTSKEYFSENFQKTVEPDVHVNLLQNNDLKISTKSYQIGKSYEILTNAAEWLIENGDLQASNCPIPSGRKRNLVNNVPKHIDGSDFYSPKKLSNGLYIEVHNSKEGLIRDSKKLLSKFGYNPEMLKMK